MHQTYAKNTQRQNTKNTHWDRCILNMPCLETKNAHGRNSIFWGRTFLAT